MLQNILKRILKILFQIWKVTDLDPQPRPCLALPVDDVVVEVPEDGQAGVGPVPALHGAVELYVAPLLHHLIPTVRVMNTSPSLCNVITSNQYNAITEQSSNKRRNQ